MCLCVCAQAGVEGRECECVRCALKRGSKTARQRLRSARQQECVYVCVCVCVCVCAREDQTAKMRMCVCMWSVRGSRCVGSSKGAGQEAGTCLWCTETCLCFTGLSTCSLSSSTHMLPLIHTRVSVFVCRHTKTAARTQRHTHMCRLCERLTQGQKDRDAWAYGST